MVLGLATLCMAGGLKQASGQSASAPGWWSQIGNQPLCGDYWREAIGKIVRDPASRTDPGRINCNYVSPPGNKYSASVGIEGVGEDQVLTVEASALVRRIQPNAYEAPGWESISCDGAAGIARNVFATLGVSPPTGISSLKCDYKLKDLSGLANRINGPSSYQATASRTVRITVPIPAGSGSVKAVACDKALFGDWKSDAPVHVKKGLTLKLQPQPDRPTWLAGKFAAQSKYRHEIGSGLSPSGVWSFADPVKSGDICTFRIKTSPLASTGDWMLRYNTRTDSFSFFNGPINAPSLDAFLPGRWTRGSPPKPAATCGKDDINGTWHRADGARVLMTGVGVFGNGGHAIMDRYPEDRWPKGESKFRGVKEVAACRYEARCTTVTSRTSSDGYSYDVKDAACTLTVDPAKRVMTASGTHGVYTRVAPNAAAERAAQASEAAEAAKARDAAAEAERTASLNREVAERDAAIKRRNAETKAADERRQREYLDAIARQKAEVERLKREEAAAKARYEAEMAAWRARVAACKAGDYAQCQ